MSNANLATMSKDELLALIATMQATPVRKLTMKVTDKGGFSIYGLGRFPFTFYVSQWDKLLANLNEVKAFVEANRKLLAVKD